MPGFFVTSTGTNIGKTFVTAGLAAYCRMAGIAVDAYKPVISGFDDGALDGSDTARILTALGRDVTRETTAALSPWRFKAALSPDMAAAREDKTIDFDALVDFSRSAIARHPSTLTLIEGVGGVMVPLDDHHTVLDWMQALQVPLVLITGSYLGTISHTLTALQVIAARHLDIAALVVSESVGSTVPLEETGAAVARFSNGVPVVTLPRGSREAIFARLAALLGV